MNLHDNEFDPSLQELEAKLSQFKVAPPTIDPKVVFYQAGFAAASARNQTRLWNQRLVSVASLLIAIGLTSIFSYQAGRSSLNVNTMLVDSRVIDSAPKASQMPVLNESDNAMPMPRAQTDWLVAICNRWFQDRAVTPKLSAVSLSTAKDPLRSLDQSLTMNFNNSLAGNVVDTQTLAGMAPTSSIDAMESKPSLDWKALLPKL